MVVCAHCIGSSLAWGLAQVLPRLEEVEGACKATTSAADVRAIIERARNHLRGAQAGAEKAAEYAPVAADALSRFVGAPVFGPDQQGWFRILYHLQNQMAIYLAGKFNYRTEGTDPRPQHVRVPSGDPAPAQDLLLWTRFLSSRIDRAAPELLINPLGEPWTDIIVGEPSSQEFFCLRARPAVLPLVTEVPYETDDAFKSKARAALEDFRGGKEFAALGRAEDAEPSEGGGWISLTQRWFKGKTKKNLFLLGAVALAAAAGIVFYLSQGKLRPQEQASSSAQPVAPAKENPAGSPPATAPIAASPPTNDQNRLAAEAETKRQLAEQQKREQMAKQQAELEAARLKTEAEAREKERLAAVEAEAKAAAERARMQAAQQTPAVEKASVASPEPNPTASVNTPVSNTSPATVVAATNESATVAAAPPAAIQTAASSGALRKVFTNSIGMILVWVAGLPGTAEGAYVAKYEVTQQQYERVTGTNPSQFKDPAQPVEMVSWQEASEFCRKLTSLDGQAAVMPTGCSYLLPTATQWEYFLGDAKFEDAVTSRTSLREGPAAVGSLAPNQYGLHDVLGNVWEFCGDEASASGERTLKGGAYNNRKLFGDKASAWKPMERTTARHIAPDSRTPDAGFRCIIK
jgi:formylglycine-generating enzyme required for sulfatase activity